MLLFPQIYDGDAVDSDNRRIITFVVRTMPPITLIRMKTTALSELISRHGNPAK